MIRDTPPHRREPTVMHGLAVVALWRSRSFNTAEIATLLNLDEATVERVISLAREAERERAAV